MKVDTVRMMTMTALMAAAMSTTAFAGSWTNSFTTAITNGFTEGCNNKIKVLKRNAYGFRNFKRFRNRILRMFAYQSQKQATV